MNTLSVQNYKTVSSRPRILILEDDHDVCSYLEELLKTDYNVTVETISHKAITTLSNNYFDIVITDFSVLPLNGLDIMQFIRKNNPVQGIILISGNPKIRNLKLPLSPTDTVLQKPIESSVLLKKIQETLTHLESVS